MDHDQRLKLLLQTMLNECVLLALPDWWSRFDFGTVEWLQQEVFFDPPQGEKGEIDLVARVKLHDPVMADGVAHLLTLLVVEVEARDRAATLRKKMFDYRNALRVRHRLPVLPIAVFMNVALNGIGWDEYEEHYWEERIEHFRYAYVGLPGLDAMTQVQSDNLLAVSLTGLMRASDDQRAQIKADAMQKAATSAKNDYVRSLMCECIHAYTELHEPHLEQFRQMLLTPKYKEAGMAGLTFREEGRLEITQQMREMIAEQLEQRFGALPAAVGEKLKTHSVEQLRQLGRKILAAKSLAELGLEP